jgi:hypothetical protein
MSDSLRDVLVELLDALEDVEAIRERALVVLARVNNESAFIPRIVRRVQPTDDECSTRAEWREPPL